MKPSLRRFVLAFLLSGGAFISCSRRNQNATPSESTDAVELTTNIPSVFTFVALGDTRFHDPSDSSVSNPEVRHALVAAIDRDRPAFVAIGGDLVYVGENTGDWDVYDSETAAWREHQIPVYPALGNHDVKGNVQKALANYFARFPSLKESLFYSVHTDNCLLLLLDSNRDELSGAQGQWLRSELDHVAPTVDFVFLVFHHPVFTSSSDEKIMIGGHSTRSAEAALGEFLEERQKQMRARVIVFNSHVHNYERHGHGGITYFVSGGGGARAYPVARMPNDPYQDSGVNYHYVLGQMDHNHLTVTMNKLQFRDGKDVWTQPDRVSITAPLPVTSAAK